MATLGDMIVKISADIQGFKDAMGQVLGSLDSFSSQAASAGAGLSVLTAPLAAISTAAVAAGLDFESAMKTIRAGSGETGASLEALGASFTKVFGSIPATAHDAAEAITIVFQRMTDEGGARLAGQQLEDFSSKMLNLARITHSEVVPLAETVTKVFKDWGMSAEKSSVAMDFLYKAAQQNGVAITKMTENLVNFGAPLRGLGFDFETATAMIARFEKEGVPLQTALAAMRFAIANFAKGGLDAKEALAATIQAIKDASTSADQMSIGLTTVGKRGMTDFVDAVKMGRFDLEKMTQDLKDNTETIDKSAAATTKFSEQWRLLQNNLEIALKPIGDTLLKSLENSMNSGFLKGLIDDVHSLADAFASLDPSTQALIVGLAGAAIAAGPVIVAFGAVAAAVTALGGVAAVAGGALALLGAAFLAFQIGGIVEESVKFVGVLEAWIQTTAMAKDAVNALCDATGEGAGKIGVLDRLFITMKADVSSWFGSISALPWAQILNPLEGFRQSIADLTLDIQHHMGIYPEFAGAVSRMSTAVAGFMSAQAAAVPGGMGIAAAVDKIKDSTTQAAIQFKLAKGAWEQLKNEQSTGVATSDQVANALVRLRAAAAAAGVDISKLVGDQKAAGDAAKAAAAAFREEEQAQVAIAKAMEALQEDKGDRQVTAQIDALYKSLHVLFVAYQDGRISMKAYEKGSADLSDRMRDLDKAIADTSDALSIKLQESYGKSLDYLHSINGRAEEITNSIFSQIGSGTLGFANNVVSGMSSATQEFTKMGVLFVTEAQKTTAAVGVAVAANIKQVFANLATLKDAFKDIGGTEADGQNQIKNIKARLDDVAKLYQDNATNLAGIQLVSDADMLRRQITSGEETIATERKIGEAVTDSQIETLRAQKVAWTNAHMDTEQAYKILHITTTKFYDDELATAQAALGKIKESTLSSHQDVLKGETDVYAAELAAQQANGDRVTAIQKEHLAKMQELSAQGMKTWVTQVDELAVDAGKAMAKGMDNIISSFLAGKLSLKKAWDEMLTELTNAFVKAFISPITKSIGDFLANSMSQLLGGKGFGGLLSSVKSVQSVIGGGTDDAGFAVSGAGSAIKSGAASNASGAASGTSSGGFGSAGSIIGIAGVAVSAAAGITAGLQMAHLISTAGKIEVNTREISTVMWQTGAESIQGLTKDIRNVLLQMNDRLVDLRTALFDPVAQDLEAILAKIGTGISVGTGIAEAVTDGTGDTTGAVETGTAGVGAAVQTASQTAGEHLLALEKQLEDLNVEIVQTKTVLSADNKALADQLKKNGDKNDPLYLALKAKVDADNALIQKDTATATAVTTAIKGQQAAIANAEKGIVDATHAAAGGIVSSVENSGSNLTGTITQTNGEIVNALGQTGSEAIAAQHEDTEALLQQLGMLGSDLTAASTLTGNAYSDLKATIKGVSAQSLADQKAAMDRMAAQALAAANMGLTSFEREFGIGGDWIKGTTGGVDDPNQYKGPSEFTPLAPMANYTAPVTGPIVSPGMGRDFSNQYGYVAPDPRNSPVAGPSAEYSRTSKYPVQYATTGNVPIVNFYGPVTDRDYAAKIANDAARQLVQAGL